MQKPMPFMHGGKVKMWSGGRVRKMQSGGVTPVPEHEDQDETPQTPLTPQDMAARQRLTTRVNESNRASTMNEKPRYRMGGRVSPVRRMQSGGAVDDRRDLLADADNSFYGGGNNPKPSPTPTPKPGFINRVKGVAKAIADRTGFQKGGRVRPVPRTKAAPKMPMMNDADADDMPLKMQDGGGVPRIDDPAHTTEPPSPLRYQMKSGGKLPPDNVPAMLGKGEVVLNKNQQKRVAVKPGWQNGLNPKEKSAMSEMRLPRMRKQHAMTGKSVPRIFGGK
jgi:hypothetical protein